eukprot:GSChrysophyteH1.ASY1.ANO1.2755.1 assembled CDS
MLKNFADNEDYIQAHNAKGKSWRLGHNQFSHLTVEEYRSYGKTYSLGHNHFSHLSTEEYKQLVPRCTRLAPPPTLSTGPPREPSLASRTRANAVPAGLSPPLYGTLESFSEQNFVSCDNRKNGGKDMGCNGGLMDNAFNWAAKNGGVCSEKDYPYTSGTTRQSGDHTDVPTKSDDAMMSALTQQPVSIAIQADQKDFQLYKSGVFTGECGTQLDHGVLAVGYGTESGSDYYKVKNSWGTTWGDKGYILLGRGSQYNKGQGQCGMLMSASYPNL